MQQPRSDTPYADLYERTKDVDALSKAAAYWALDTLRDPHTDEFGIGVAERVVRLAMRTRREMRSNRNRILAESFQREVCGG